MLFSHSKRETIHEDQVMITDEGAKGGTSSGSFAMDFDEWSINSTSTLTFMPCMEDNSYTKSTIPMAQSSITMTRVAGVVYQLLEENTKRRQLSSFQSSGNLYCLTNSERMRREGGCPRGWRPYRQCHPICSKTPWRESKGEEPRKSGLGIKGAQRWTHKAQPLAKICMSFKFLDFDSTVWCRENNKNGKRLRQWLRSTWNHMDQNMTIQIPPRKRKLYVSCWKISYMSRSV